MGRKRKKRKKARRAEDTAAETKAEEQVGHSPCRGLRPGLCGMGTL